MKSKLICLLLLVACKLSFAGSAGDSLLEKLNLTIENAHIYDAEKLKQIHTLRQAFAAARHLPLQQQFDICQQLYEQFKVFKYDSAFAYARKLQELAREMNDSQRINYAGVKLGFVLLSSGMFREAGDNKVSLPQMPWFKLNIIHCDMSFTLEIIAAVAATCSQSSQGIGLCWPSNSACGDAKFPCLFKSLVVLIVRVMPSG